MNRPKLWHIFRKFSTRVYCAMINTKLVSLSTIQSPHWRIFRLPSTSVNECWKFVHKNGAAWELKPPGAFRFPRTEVDLIFDIKMRKIIPNSRIWGESPIHPFSIMEATPAVTLALKRWNFSNLISFCVDLWLRCDFRARLQIKATTRWLVGTNERFRATKANR